MKWTAIYKDRTELKEFEENEDGDVKENLFGDIDQDNLLAFRVDDGVRHLVVDLSNGLFLINGTVFNHPELTHKEVDYRLIFFKRVAQNIGVGKNSVSENTRYHVGWQFTEDDTNYKKIFSIDNHGIVVPEE